MTSWNMKPGSQGPPVGHRVMCQSKRSILDLFSAHPSTCSTEAPRGMYLQARSAPAFLRVYLLLPLSGKQRHPLRSVEIRVSGLGSPKGAEGQTQVMCSLQHGAVSANLHFAELNPHLEREIQESCLAIPSAAPGLQWIFVFS